MYEKFKEGSISVVQLGFEISAEQERLRFTNHDL